MPTLYVDTETRSRCDLPACGAQAYARHPSTEVLLIPWALDDGPVQCVDVLNDQWADSPLVKLMADPSVEVVFHNAGFDWPVLTHCFGFDIKVDRIRDTMVKAYTLGLPGGLEKLGVALGLEDDFKKMAEGKRLIRMFSMPTKDGNFNKPLDFPEDWALFKQYALRDVETTRRIDQILPNWNYRGSELELWRLDMLINDFGLPIDVELAVKAAKLCEEETKRLNQELKELTKGAVDAHSKRDQMLTWMDTRGVVSDGYTKADVTGLLERKDLPEDVRRALEIRREAGRTSTTKFKRFVDVQTDGRVRGAFQFCGAQRTGRWAGRLIQPQNFPRPTIKDTSAAADAIVAETVGLLYDQPLDVAASCVRSVITAPKGYQLVAGDYANIEGRMLAWLADAHWKLEAFREYDCGTGPDLYKLAYSKSFNVPVESVDSEQRFVGKVQELSLGYQGGYRALGSMALAYGVEIEEERGREITAAWRSANPEIVTLWHEVEEAALQALRHRGKRFKARHVVFGVERDWLLCRLPSGRMVPYFKPAIKDGSIVYQGIEKGRWVEIQTFGGKLVENITQAASRDVLAWNLLRLHKLGWQVVGSVHDEIITQQRLGDPQRSAKALEKDMADIPMWCPDLPLAVEAYAAKRYRK